MIKTAFYFLAPFKRYLNNPRYRKFISLYNKYKDYTRYKPVVTKDLGFPLIVSDPVSFIWQYKEIFLDNCYLFETKEKNPLIIDCGSNIGLSVIYFKQTHPGARVIAYEADKAIAEILTKNVLQNCPDNVEIINAAVWTDNSGVEFSGDGADGGSIYDKHNPVKTASVRLRDELQKHNRIDFLKIDIEGAEYDVIKDCRDDLSQIRYLFLEYHSFTDQPQILNEILDILTKAGFTYHIQSLSDTPSPFIKKQGSSSKIDLQLNIFCTNKNVPQHKDH